VPNETHVAFAAALSGAAFSGSRPEPQTGKDFVPHTDEALNDLGEIA
jgi:hypothetical protein